MSTLESVKGILGETLQLKDKGASLKEDTPMFGSIPEFDSAAVVFVLTAIEERFDVMIEDDEISAETFETVGSLTDFVEQKQRGG